MTLDSVEIQVFRHLLAAIPEEMGVVLMRAAFSPNIKERLDFSCALTGPDGDMAAQASHIPVHLGSVHVTGRHLLERVDLKPGDLVLLNDPYRGGTHLPDVTLFAPVFLAGVKGPALGAMVRAHHADIGGGWPGSMGPATDLYGEGLVIPPVRLVREGVIDDDVLQMVLANTRTPDERRGDLLAQKSAVERGRDRLKGLAEEYGGKRLLAAVTALRAHAARVTRSMLRSLDDGTWTAEGHLDGPGTPCIRVRITKRRARLHVDFTGTDAEIDAPFNANEAITLSAVFYVVRLLVAEEVPTNSGCLDPVRVTIPNGCLLNANRPSPVAGGNVETSQRIVDVLLQALAAAAPDRVPASSQGTMNNLTVGGRLADGSPFTFYETLGGGTGGGPRGPGESGIQSHMTNTLNTPVEALENAFPVLVRRYRLRDGSGGDGDHGGGDGLVREIELLAPARVTVLAGRRAEGAPGVGGGAAGAPGRDRVDGGGRWRRLPDDGSVTLDPGDAVRIETPGGGGFVSP
ncbi:MAG: 5-oxoprolinase [Planctomycetes bacterium]|nr:5-oxoprolinase [Planctomycetota bacterium]